jgi:hypothetical protein
MPRFVPPPELLDSPVDRPFDRPDDDWLATADGPVPTRARLVVVGGGPAAMAVLSQLWHDGGLAGVVVLDAHGRPAGRFLDRVRRLRQRVLRSPYEHHVGAHNGRDCEMLDFARAQWRHLTPIERGQVRMAMSGQRSVVPLDVFDAYLAHVCANHGLAGLLWRSRVSEVVAAAAGGWCVRHDSGEIHADVVVFALGEETRPLPSGWAADPRVTRWDEAPVTTPGETVAVAGAGLGAAHLVNDACAAGAAVYWIQRTGERYQCADVNARYFRPEGRAEVTDADHDGRLAILRRQRRPTIMLEFEPLLRGWERDGRLRVCRGRSIVGLDTVRGGFEIRLDDGSRIPGVDRVVCAFGTSPTSPSPPAADDVPVAFARAGAWQASLGSSPAATIRYVVTRVDRRTAAAQHLQSCLDGHRVRRSHHRLWRRKACRDPAGDQQQSDDEEPAQHHARRATMNKRRKGNSVMPSARIG